MGGFSFKAIKTVSFIIIYLKKQKVKTIKSKINHLLIRIKK